MKTFTRRKHTQPEFSDNQLRRDTIIRRAAAVLCAAIIITAAGFTADYLLCFSAADRLTSISSYAQIKYIIYGTSEGTVSARFWLYDINGRELASIERSWNANSLSVDFVSAEFGGKIILFPYIIYGNEPYKSGIGFNYTDYKKTAAGQRRKGTPLPRYYMASRKNLLYTFSSGENGTADGAAVQRSFDRMARYALRPDFSGAAQFVSWSAHRSLFTIDLSESKPGLLYSIIINDSGSIVIAL